MKGIWYYMERDMIKWLRGKLSVVSMMVMPAAWLIFVGLALPVKFTGN
ncbi:MAG: multidrug ABC transporter permease, partial [Methanoregula sp.]|nr:multidrug ABC transporter permease [Methanoregula sp.]